MQRVDIRMNSQDWEKLKQDFQENTYYPADIAWNGQTARNPASAPAGSARGAAPSPACVWTSIAIPPTRRSWG